MTTKQLITTETLIRATGPFAIAAGLIFAGIQPIHPPDYLASVTTGTWATFMYAKLAMCLFFLVGITGIYSRQATRAGWLGLAGFALLIVTLFLQSAFIFTEGFILPIAANVAPQLVESFLTLAKPRKTCGHWAHIGEEVADVETLGFAQRDDGVLQPAIGY